jgi:ATP-dependent DNA helicase RecG
MMIEQCRGHGLPEPRFSQDGHEFMVTLWRDWLTPERVAGFGLNERQRLALEILRSKGRITNTEYQTTFSVAKRTAHGDLAELTDKGLVEMVGSTGKGTYYELAKGAAKGPNGPHGAAKGPKGSRRK